MLRRDAEVSWRITRPTEYFPVKEEKRQAAMLPQPGSCLRPAFLRYLRGSQDDFIGAVSFGILAMLRMMLAGSCDGSHLFISQFIFVLELTGVLDQPAGKS